MTKKLIAVLTALAFTCATITTAYAAPPEEPKVASMRAGDKAPFQGVLLNPAAYAQLRAATVTLSDLCKLDIDTALARGAAAYELRIAILQAELKAERTQRVELLRIKSEHVQYLEKQLLAGGQPSWNEAWFAGGIVAGALVTIGIGFAVAEAQR